MAIWKKINFEPGYSLSEFGDVRNDKTGLILKFWVLKNGYHQTRIRKNTYSIHRIVAMVFHSSSEINGDIVIHVDDNKSNNHYSNLKWGTQSENIRLAYLHGRMQDKKGEKHPMTRFTNSQVIEIRNRINSGDRVCAIAREFGVCHQTISSIKTGKNWK